MAFVLSRVTEPNDIVDIHYVALVDSTARYLVVARRTALDLYWLEPDHTLTLRRSIPILDTILDVKTITPLDIPGTWLVVTTESNKVLLVAFRGTIKNDVVVEEYDLKEMGHILSIEPRTLCAESGRFFSLYSTEGSICLFTMHRGKDMKNFAKALDPKSKGKQILFKPPQVFTMTNTQGRTPLVIQSVESHYEENVGDATLSVLYRDDLYNYYSSYFTADKGQFDQIHRLKLPEEMSPIILPLNNNLGSILFGKTGIFIRSYPEVIESLKAAPELTSSKDGQSIEVIHSNGKLQLIKKKSLTSKWTVSTAFTIDSGPFGNTSSILFTTSEGFLHLTEIETEVLQDNFGYPEFASIKSWKLRRFPLKLFAAEKITQITQTTFVAFSNTHGISTFTIDTKAMTLTILYKKSVTPPILDFNLSVSSIPKIQLLGGSSTVDGLLRTEFEGFETEIIPVGKVNTTEGVTGIWKFGQTYVVNHLDGIQIFQENDDGDLLEINEFHGLSMINGGVVDMFMMLDQLICITETGVYQDGKRVKQATIEAGVITKSGTAITVSNGTIEAKSQKYKLSEEVSCIHALELGRSLHIITGTWSGEVNLFIDGSKKLIHKSDLAIYSVLIKKIGLTAVYVIGGADGSVTIITGKQTTELSIGSAPVSVCDFDERSIITGNKENMIMIVLDTQGRVVDKGYLGIEFPEAIHYDPVSSKVVMIRRGKIGVLEVSPICQTLQNEMTLNRLPRCATKFKNFRNLTLMVTVTEKYNESIGRDMMISQLEVVDNNTFKTRSVFRFEGGIEVTDVVNTTYKKEIIDSYEEEKINMGFENVLSQCFVVSCLYHTQDESGPPLMLFSIDEDGNIQHQCSTEKTNMSFYSLTNHANRLVIGAGKEICAYQILYSIADSKFSLKKVSDPFETRYYSSCIKSVGSDVVVSDIIKNPIRLKLKVKDTVEEGGTVFKFHEDTTSDLDCMSFVTSLETYENLVIATELLKNVQISLFRADSISAVFQFNIGDQINVVRKIERSGTDGLSKNDISSLLVDGESLNNVPDVVPIFLLGSVGGGLYLLSMATTANVVDVLETAQEEIVRRKLKVLSKKRSEDERLEQYVSLRNWRGTRRNVKAMSNFIDGDLIRKYDDDLARDLIEQFCKI